jgi:anti-anti-sigma regulatory factor
MSRFSLDRQGPKVTVKMCAELTAPVVPELRDLLCAIHDDGVQELTLDFAGTTVLDAAGLSLLLAARNSFQGQRAFRLAAVQPQLLSLLETLKLDRRLHAQTG